MSTVSELILIRHGESMANVAFPLADAAGSLESGLTGRDADVELTEPGIRQARAVGRWLAALPADRLPQVVTTSPYRRARETWRIAALAAERDLPAPGVDDRLVDRLLGELEMLTRAAIAARYPGEIDRWRAEGQWRYRPPGGESFGDIAERLDAFLADLERAHAGRRVVVVAHDAVVLMMRFVIERLTWPAIEAVERAGRVLNASITRFDGSSGRLMLDRYNSVEHLPAYR